jgi:hypothetical protein
MIAKICGASGTDYCVAETPPPPLNDNADLNAVFDIVNPSLDPNTILFLGNSEVGDLSSSFNLVNFDGSGPNGAGLDPSGSGSIVLVNTDLQPLYYTVKADGIAVLYTWSPTGNTYNTSEWGDLPTLEGIADGSGRTVSDFNSAFANGNGVGVSNVRLWGVPEPNSAILYGLAVLFTGIGIRRRR